MENEDKLAASFPLPNYSSKLMQIGHKNDDDWNAYDYLLAEKFALMCQGDIALWLFFCINVFK